MQFFQRRPRASKTGAANGFRGKQNRKPRPGGFGFGNAIKIEIDCETKIRTKIDTEIGTRSSAKTRIQSLQIMWVLKSKLQVKLDGSRSPRSTADPLIKFDHRWIFMGAED
ncbi:hypothetical protein EVAR_5570_1 [Eumeta japonica]|uniref:Uncharacterized protein n=1 Tax=Eumeta variegata TaxID=151549 RepID=A0A4C1U1L1_EUMVA|nr:hypothetical protein EVAR_5570_1 [Eumeta japonica]